MCTRQRFAWDEAIHEAVTAHQGLAVTLFACLDCNAYHLVRKALRIVRR